MYENNIAGRLSEYNDIYKENDNIYRDIAKNLGLSECSFWTLYTLRTHFIPPVQSEISAFLHQPKQTVNSALKKMESDGYITLAQGKDLRSKQILLTQKGSALCEKTVDRVIAMEQNAFADLSDEEQQMFLSLFHKYTDMLKKHMQNITERKDNR